MTGHTPGEWFYESADRGNRYVIRFKAPHYTGRGEVLAQHIERAEDAKLMAAAPAMADMLATRRPHKNACRSFPAVSEEQIMRECDCGLAALLRAAGRLP